MAAKVGEKSKVNRDDFSITDQGQIIHFDVVLLCIHGTPGEDGKLQGYFDMLKLPYTSCDAATSALTFNKRYTVAVAAFGGVQIYIIYLNKTKHGEKNCKNLKKP